MMDDNSFDGYNCFEEISSYKLLKKGTIPGLLTPKIEKIKKGRITKNSRKEKKIVVSTKATNVTIEQPNVVAPVKEINTNSWTAIFTSDLIIKAISKLGFVEPTEIQKLTIPAAIKAHKDIIGAAETGSGKTLAFAIPIIQGILVDKEKEMQQTEVSDDFDTEKDIEMSDEEVSDEESDKRIGCVKVIEDVEMDFLNEKDPEIKGKLRAVVVTPTRELAVQIKKHFDALLKDLDITTALVIGGFCMEKQERLLLKGPDIVIGTPGRIWQMIELNNPHLSEINSIRYLAVDETDRMVQKGHFQELRQLLELINSNSEAKKLRQSFVFSATLTLEHDIPDRLKKQFKKKKKKIAKVTSEDKLQNLIDLIGIREKPKIVDITRKTKTAENLSEGKIFCDKNEKEIYLYYFLRTFPGRTLVFCNSIDCVRRLTSLLTILQFNPQALHASKHQKQRLKSLERFTSDPKALLLSTDVAARGLDIPSIDHIVHYEVPKAAETYVHRSGRTARANKDGISILLLEPSEVSKYRKLGETLGRSSDLPSFPVEQNTISQIKERVSLAKEIEIAEFRLKKEAFKENMENKLENDGFIFKEKKMTVDYEDFLVEEAMKKRRQNKAIKAMKGQLKSLLSQPLLTPNYSSKYPTLTGNLILPNTKPSQQTAISIFNKESEEYKKLSSKFKFNLPLKKERKKSHKNKPLKRLNKRKQNK